MEGANAHDQSLTYVRSRGGSAWPGFRAGQIFLWNGGGLDADASIRIEGLFLAKSRILPLGWAGLRKPWSRRLSVEFPLGPAVRTSLLPSAPMAAYTNALESQACR